MSRELTWTITTLWIALFIGWIIDSFPLALLGYLLFYIARHLYSVRKFELWMKKDSSALYPPSSGFWAEVAHLVSRKQRSLEKHADLQLHKYEQFQAASMSIPDAIISINPKGKIEWFNAAAKKMLKLKQSDVGYSLEMLLRVPEFIRYFKNEDYSKPLILPSLKGTQRVFSVSVFRYYLHHKLVVIKDIHELYNLAQIRKDFIANASHELRTPLT
ncbi:MAG: phosphate regulon sensor protein PhoR, partial [Hydrogenovibrio sp.]|nr:phosphate regulon sensor protein PhoR [Hydrogenovibrio sp.]